MSLQDVIFLSKYWKLENLVFKKQGERRSRPEVFLKISQNSKKKACAAVSS